MYRLRHPFLLWVSLAGLITCLKVSLELYGKTSPEPLMWLALSGWCWWLAWEKNV